MPHLRPAQQWGLAPAEQGLWRPRRQRIRQPGWRPALRVQETIRFQVAGQRWRAGARALVPGPGHAWVGAGVAFNDRALRRAGTLMVVRGHHQQAP